jgi:hypothetical protein
MNYPIRLARCPVVDWRLEESGAHFRSLRDPIDTSTPQGMFSLQVLGAVAQLERALISERTKAGIKAARARGKLPGNPGLRARDPEAIRKVAAARDHVFTTDVIASMDRWLPPCGACARNIPGKTSCAFSTKQMAPVGPWSGCGARSEEPFASASLTPNCLGAHRAAHRRTGS